VAGAVAPALSHSVLSLALGQAFFVLLSLACWDTARRHRRKLRARGESTP
jgi:DHA1 family bicyclomycin/chloramphenicol resistance-like MFS transporter